MKKLFVLLLAVLMLSGCTQSLEIQPPETESTVLKEDDTPEPTGCYDPERSTQALRAYLVPATFQQVVLVDGDPVLISNQGHLQRLQGEDGIEAAAGEMEAGIYEGVAPVTVYEDRLAYYVAATREVVVLDGNLQILQRIELPEEAQGTPVISLKNGTVYYCTDDQVCRLRMETGISSALKTHSCKAQDLVGSLLDGDILALRMIDSQDQMHLLYIRGEDGQTVSDDAGILELYTGGEAYYALRNDGMVRQQIVGTLEGEPRELTVDPRNKEFMPALEMGAVAAYDPEEGSLSLYDVESGTRRATVDLSVAETILDTACNGTYFWILAQDQQLQTVLFRWDPAKSTVTEEAVYLTDLRTADDPDLDGIAQCEEKAEELSKRYDVKIRIWQDAVTVTDGHTCTPEYQVAAIESMLDSLEAALSLLPEGFAGKTANNPIQIQLVRSLDGQQESCQFWQDGYAYIILCAGSDLEREFLQSFGLVMDAYIMGHSRKFDKWDQLNPEEFAYAYDERINEAREDLSLLEGEDPTFLDQESMSFPSVDRSHVFYYAISWEGAGKFDTPVMQKKLETLCRAIREAYRLEKSTETYPWEQYLEISLAYTK